MSEVLLRDMLWRAGGKALLRYGVPVVAGPGIGRTEEARETYSRPDATTCATYFDRDGLAVTEAATPTHAMRRAAAGILRPHWPPGIVGADGLPLCGILLESTRQNKADNGDAETDANGWAATGGSTVVRDPTAGNPAPCHGGFAVKITTINGVSSGAYLRLRSGARIGVTATSNRLHTWSVWVYAPAASVGKTVKIRVEWWDVTPAQLGATETTGIALVLGWQRIKVTSAALTGAVTADLYIGGDAAQGVWSIWADVAQFEEGAYASSAIPTNTAAVTRADETFDAGVCVDMLGDFTIYIHALADHSNVASWPDTEPQVDAFCLGLYPTVAGTDAVDSLRLHRQNGNASYEWEYGANTPTAGRTFTPGVAPQKLVMRHYAVDHHLDCAIDGSAFVASGVPAAFTVKPLIMLRLSGGPAFSAKGPGWTLFDAICAKGLRTQAEMEAIP